MTRLLLAVFTLVLGVGASSCAVGVRQPAGDITKTSATLNGKVLSTTGGPGSWYFEYGTTADRAERTPSRSIDFEAGEIVPVAAPLDGLEPGTIYHFATCAEDNDNGGEAFCSPEKTFRTRFETLPSQDYAIGTGTSSFLGFTAFDFEVISGHSGENPMGWGTALLSGRSSLTVTEATCLSVTGNTATTVGRLAPNTSSWLYVKTTVVDNSPAGTDTFRATVGIGFPFPTDPGCSQPVPSAGAPLVSGDIVVHDAPAPSSANG